MKDPIVLAIAHQLSINDKRLQIQADASCIRQLLVGRDVQRRSVSGVFRVTGTRLGLSGAVEIRGRFNNKGRERHIGTVAEIELAP